MGNPSSMRDFVVAAWERNRHRERDLRHVVAATAEGAIVAIAAARPLALQPGIYEAWPANDPGSNLRITYAAATGRQLSLRPERY